MVLAAVAGIWWALRPHAPPQAILPSATKPLEARFVGSEACAGCHANASAAWKGSQHAHAMQHATAETVLGNFDDARFHYAGIESTFFRRDGKYFVHTDGADGKLADFEIKYTFGVEPLQQYLVEFPDGRLQALSIAWDTRPPSGVASAGSTSIRTRKSIIATSCTGPATRKTGISCAPTATRPTCTRITTPPPTRITRRFKEISVGCEACHGPGSAHLDWARTKPADKTEGLTVP